MGEADGEVATRGGDGERGVWRLWGEVGEPSEDEKEGARRRLGALPPMGIGLECLTSVRLLLMDSVDIVAIVFILMWARGGM